MTEYVTRHQAAELAGVAVSTIQSHRYPGKFTRQVPFPEPATRLGRVPDLPEFRVFDSAGIP